MSTIIVGVDESQGSSDAIALASSLAGITGSEAHARQRVPIRPRPSRASTVALRSTCAQSERAARGPAQHPWRRDRRGQGDRQHLTRPWAAQARRERRRRPGRRGLHAHRPRRTCAARQHRRAAPPRITLPGGGGAKGLCAALERRARGHRLRLRRLTVGRARARDGAPPRGGDRGAAAGDSRLHPAGLRPPPDSVLVGGMASYNDTLHERAAGELEAAVASIDAEPGVEAEFTVGDPAHILTEASEELDCCSSAPRLRPDTRRPGRGRRRAPRARGGLPRDRGAAWRATPGGFAVREARRRTPIVQLR